MWSNLRTKRPLQTWNVILVMARLVVSSLGQAAMHLNNVVKWYRNVHLPFSHSLLDATHVALHSNRAAEAHLAPSSFPRLV